MDSVNGSAPPRPDVKYATKDQLAHEMVADRELPSGLVVRARRGTLGQFLIEDGELPNHLRELVVSVESGARDKQLASSPETFTTDDIVNFETLQYRFISHYLEAPTLTPAEVPRHLSPEDRAELFTFIIHGDVLAGIARFRQQAELHKLEGAGDRGGAGGS